MVPAIDMSFVFPDPARVRTNVDVRLRSLVGSGGICAIDAEGAGGVLLLEGGLKGAAVL